MRRNAAEREQQLPPRVDFESKFERVGAGAPHKQTSCRSPRAQSNMPLALSPNARFLAYSSGCELRVFDLRFFLFLFLWRVSFRFSVSPHDGS